MWITEKLTLDFINENIFVFDIMLKIFLELFSGNDVSTRASFLICTSREASSFAPYTGKSKRNNIWIIHIYFGNHKMLYTLVKKLAKHAITFVIKQIEDFRLKVSLVPRN